MHPRDASGTQSLGVRDVTAAVAAIPAAVPTVPVGVSTLDAIAGGRTVKPGEDGVAAARAVLAALGSPAPADVVVHGEDAWAWPVLRWSAAEAWGIRAGLEDIVEGPQGERVTDNAELIAYAVGFLRR